MKQEIYDYEKERKKAEKRKRWNDRKAKAANWVWRNRNWIVPLVPVVVSGGFATAKVVGKRANLHKEEEVKNCTATTEALGITGLCAVSLRTTNGLKSTKGKQTEKDLLIFSKNLRFLSKNDLGAAAPISFIFSQILQSLLCKGGC